MKDVTINTYKNFNEFLVHQSKHYGAMPALSFPETGVTFTYQELNTAVDQTAAFLSSRGLKKGDRYGTRTRNCPEFVLLYLASMKLGIPVVPLAFDLPPQGVCDAIERFELKTLFIGDASSNNTEELQKITCQHFDIFTLTEKIRMETPNESLYADVLLEDPGCLYFSSGTTGTPKGISLSPMRLLYAAESLARAYRRYGVSKQMGILPCYHTALASYGVLPTLLMGEHFVLFERFSRTRFWKDIAEHGITFVNIVPTILSMLLHPAEDSTRYDLSRLAFIGSGSAPLPASLQKTFEDTFNVQIANQYGLSETLPTHFNAPYGNERREGSIGKALPHTDVDIVNEDGTRVQNGETGEIIVRGKNVIDHYYDAPQEADASFRDSWFYTGDLAHKDAEGYYFLEGRKKEMINRGGQKIYPNEVDTVLLALPEVIKEAATIGVPDPLYGEEIVSYVVLVSGHAPDTEVIMKHCAKHLPPYKCPKKIFFVDTIPQTASGKIFRRKLQEQWESDFGIQIITPDHAMLASLQDFYTRVYRSDHPLVDRRFLTWFLSKNPFFKEKGFSCVIALHDNAIIGHLLFIPVPLWSDGRVVRGAWTGNFIVDERYRGKGIGSKLIKEVESRFDVILDIGAHKDAQRILHKKGWHNFGNLYRAVGILNAEKAKPFVPQTFSEKNRTILRREQHHTYTVRHIKRFNAHTDKFWDTYRKGIGACTDRTADFLNWRYADHPYFEYALFEVANGATVVGFAVARTEAVFGSDTRIVRITEYIAEDDARSALLAALIAYTEKQDACLIDFFSSAKKYLTCFEKAGFYLSPEADEFASRFQPVQFEYGTLSFNVANHTGAIRPEIFLDRENWYVTSGDGDRDRPNIL